VSSQHLRLGRGLNGDNSATQRARSQRAGARDVPVRITQTVRFAQISCQWLVVVAQLGLAKVWSRDVPLGFALDQLHQNFNDGLAWSGRMASSTYAVGQSYRSDRMGRQGVDGRLCREFDVQPFHLDEVSAFDTIFRGFEESGLLTAAMSMWPLVDGEVEPAGGIVGPGFNEFSWPRSVRARG